MTHEMHEEEHTDRVTRLDIEDAEAADRERQIPRPELAGMTTTEFRKRQLMVKSAFLSLTTSEREELTELLLNPSTETEGASHE
ncbi:hypothetical protein C3B59_00030 [Cryobacterium zongtaii]|uniref:Uncharacterized protein n=1 Tax=Cryobacterium zongtaii TaxID=1259217 RepID=A0A2S3ZQN7_9MICO|nr:hypothetical protein [Cryobacterium zongtaii]POH71548.1 hypothetical protein C3B59_00030 [Cryobacterium zongtaii]